MTIDRSQRREWAREHFRGAENIILPSFTADLAELDDEGIRRDVRQSVRHGVFSTFCSVEAGLTMDERKRFMEVAVEAADGEICVGFALAGDSQEENLELLEHGERIGCSHALVSYPHAFAPASEDEVYRFNRELCDATNLGIVLFHNDKFGYHRFHPSGAPLDAFDRLADVPNVVGLKTSGMDLAMVQECFERLGDRILVSVPTILQIPIVATTFPMQWTGAWTIEALQTPEQPYVIEFLDLLASGRVEEAMGAFWRMGPLLGMLGPRLAQMFPTGIYHWTLFKYFQWLSGGNGGTTRQPAMRLSGADMAEIRGAFMAAGLEPAEGSDEEFLVGRSALARQAVAG